MSTFRAPPFIWRLFEELRRRRFALGLDDYEALRLALRAGFGWESPSALSNIICTLWAKSQSEQEVIVTLFNREANEFDWKLPALDKGPEDTDPASKKADQQSKPSSESDPINQPPTVQLAPELDGRLPLLSFRDLHLINYFVYVPSFPLTHREVAQTWRRLRRPVRSGPPIELDVQATIARRARQGVAAGVELVPRRLNTARVLLLVDRQGSMAPFHPFAELVCLAICESANLKKVALYYFHDTPVSGANQAVLSPLRGELFPLLDSILSKIEPCSTGDLYTDADLLVPLSTAEVLEAEGRNVAIVLISDAGAARAQYDPIRLLNTLAFLKALKAYSHRVVWLNPIPKEDWRDTTAAQIARHVPMFPLTAEGMQASVDVLRGRPYYLEQLL